MVIKLVGLVPLIALAMLVVPLQPVSATTYFVDTSNSAAANTNSGTQAQPWKTIAKAASTMMPGDTTIVVAGTYNENVSTVRSGMANARITFRAQGRVLTRTFEN